MWAEAPGMTDIPTESQGSYTVKKWDTLSKIAQEKKIPLRDLIAAQWSNFDPNKLRIGQVLNMPEKNNGQSIDDIQKAQKRALWYAWWNDTNPAWTMSRLDDGLAYLFPGMTPELGSFKTPKPITFGTRIQRNTEKSETDKWAEILIRFPYTADDFYPERNPVRPWVIHAELLNYTTRGGTIDTISPEIRKTLTEAISKVNANYDGGVGEINRPNISLANDAPIRNPENIELAQLSGGNIEFRLKGDPTLHTFGYNSAQGTYGLKNIRS